MPPNNCTGRGSRCRSSAGKSPFFTCGHPTEVRDLRQTQYARWRRKTLHFYCERCDQPITDEIARFIRHEMRTTLCSLCMEDLGHWTTTRATLTATYGPVTDEQVDAAIVDWGERFWTTLGPGDPKIRARYGLDR